MTVAKQKLEYLRRADFLAYHAALRILRAIQIEKEKLQCKN
jgi:hypothetical protein